MGATIILSLFSILRSIAAGSSSSQLLDLTFAEWC